MPRKLLQLKKMIVNPWRSNRCREKVGNVMILKNRMGIGGRGIAETTTADDRLEQSWQDRSRGSAVLLVFRTEGGRHEALFYTEFHGEADPEKDDGNQASKLSTSDGGAEHGKDHSGVDGMTNPAIRTRTDKLMSNLDGDCAAPVSAEVGSGPDGEQQAGRSYRNAKVFDPRIGRQNAKPHPTVGDDAAEHRVEGGDVKDDVRNPGAEALSGLCLLGSDRPHQPDHKKGRPEIADNAHFTHLAPRGRYVAARARVPETGKCRTCGRCKAVRISLPAMRPITAHSEKLSTSIKGVAA